MKREEYEDRLDELQNQLDDLFETDIEEEEVEEEEVYDDSNDKPTEERYRRPSVNWGVIAVHPSDLFAKYKKLATARTAFISTSQGGTATRTTALAYALLSRDALIGNGYTPEEVSSILASVVANGV